MKKSVTFRILIMFVVFLLALPPASALACGGGSGGNGGGDSDTSMGSGRFGGSFELNRGLSRSVARTQDNISNAVRRDFGSPSFQNPGVARGTVDVGRTEPVKPMSRQELQELEQDRAEAARQHAGRWDWATTSAEWTLTGAKIAGWGVATYVTWGTAPTAAAAFAQSTAWGVGSSLAGSAASSLGEYLAGNDPRVIQTIAYDQTKGVLTSALPPGIDLVSDFGMDALTTVVVNSATKNDATSPNLVGGAQVRDRIFQEPQDAPRSGAFDMRGEQQTTQEAW